VTDGSGAWSVALAAGCELAERPVWDEHDQSLVWVDILGGSAHRLSPGGDDTAIPVGAPLGAAGLRHGGGLILASAGALVFLDAAGRADREPIDAGLPSGVRFNDGACDPAGRFLVGTSSLDGRRERGALLAVSPDGHIEVLLDGVTESNGLCWSPDGGTLYYVDSGEQHIRAYAYDVGTGRLGARRDIVRIDDADGVPDGLAIDRSGAIWVALWEGWAVRRYAADGRQLAHLPLPVSRPTCPGFGAGALDRLFVTSAWEGMTPAGREGERWAGHVLVCEPGVSGMTTYRFAG
jgi:sugar lactone lactonase YvrE